MNYLKLLHKYHRQVGYGYTHYLFSSLGQTFFISLFVQSFNLDLGMKNQGFSVVYAIATIASSLTLPFVGSLLDKIKLSKFSVLNGLVLAFFCMVVSFSQNRIMLLFGLYGLRLTGQGLMVLIGSTAIARNFQKERGKALSLSNLGLSTGEAIMPAIGILLINLAGWQHAWQILAGLTVVFFIPVVSFIIPLQDPFHIPPLQNKEKVINDSDKSRRQVLNDGRFYVLVANIIMTPFFITGMFIHHNLLAQLKGWDMTWIATCFIGYGITKTISSLVAGPLVDSYSAKKVFPFYLLPMAFGALSLLVLGNNPMIALLYLCLTAISVSLMSVASTALWVELYGHTHFGAIKSMVTTVVVFASAIGPVVIGSFMGNEIYWQTGLIACLLFMLSTSLSSYFALRK
jgi:MFS family permease